MISSNGMPYPFYRLYDIYAQHNYQPNLLTNEFLGDIDRKPIHLGVPKTHSLTDSMLRNTLGC